jgi:hypothetical protein
MLQKVTVLLYSNFGAKVPQSLGQNTLKLSKSLLFYSFQENPQKPGGYGQFCPCLLPQAGAWQHLCARRRHLLLVAAPGQETSFSLAPRRLPLIPILSLALSSSLSFSTHAPDQTLTPANYCRRRSAPPRSRPTPPSAPPRRPRSSPPNGARGGAPNRLNRAEPELAGHRRPHRLRPPLTPPSTSTRSW